MDSTSTQLSSILMKAVATQVSSNILYEWLVAIPTLTNQEIEEIVKEYEKKEIL